MAKDIVKEYQRHEKNSEWNNLFVKLRVKTTQNDIPCKIARKLENSKRNRYRDVLPYDHSRVYLQETDNDYINASIIPVAEVHRKHVLTQGPLENTADHFWQMVWEQRSKAVIMLSKVVEKNQPKCYQYFPAGVKESHVETMTFKESGFVLELKSCDETENYIERVLSFTRISTAETREIFHFQFTTWPDFGVPENTSSFLEFLHEVRRSGCLDCTKHGPPVIHCSAGIGRSGAFIVVDAALVMAKLGHKSIDICNLVVKLRKYRMGLIQTSDQLRFCYKAIHDALTCDRWKDLIDLACISTAQAAVIAPDSGGLEGLEGSRPSLKRLQGQDGRSSSRCSSSDRSTGDRERALSSSSSNGDSDYVSPLCRIEAGVEPDNSPKKQKTDPSTRSDFPEESNSVPPCENLSLSSSQDSADPTCVQRRIAYSQRQKEREAKKEQMRKRLSSMKHKQRTSETPSSTLWNSRIFIVGGSLAALSAAFLGYYLYNYSGS